MVNREYPIVGASIMRLTRLDGCGRPVYGNNTRLVTEGFVSIAATAQTLDSEAITVTNANGKPCVSRPAKQSITGFALALTFCKVNPDAFNIVTGQDVVLDADGNAVGFDVDVDVAPGDVGFALEVWSDIIGEACAEGGEGEGTWGYLLYPFVKSGLLGDHTIENAALTFAITGAATASGGDWGEGPYNVTLDGEGDPSPLLTALTGTKHFRSFFTELAPPEPTDGAVPLDDPSFAAATGATEGSPGVFTPADRNRPDTSMAGITATPSSAWDEGSYVETEDGNPWHWNGTVWVAGVAPA